MASQQAGCTSSALSLPATIGKRNAHCFRKFQQSHVGNQFNWNPERQNSTKGTDESPDGSETASEAFPPKLSCLMRSAETPCSLSSSDACCMNALGPHRKKVGPLKPRIRSSSNSLFNRPLLAFHPASGALSAMISRNRASEPLKRVNSS
jgi:hypothetical protein